ncbi:uncharacterized protein BX663DRAFT_531442 [Cokeromyces recurvatus]|uniref:uncharacterized protein n=1 Tax=Cokeromyces recurvatus TaxID=90255 RepID=UPI00221F0EAF|nr:uncharacterized protein BX663DRAFT_531442 [Cokeromyces recurvatus]KAI7902028.1 hypothetical protein BX663DRAFT_531442 [Cokeromyces recurvatus]
MRTPIYANKQHKYESVQAESINDNTDKQFMKKVFEQNFRYSTCRVVNANMSLKQLSSKYPQILFISDTWIELVGIEGVDLIVKRNGLTNYGQVLSSACETLVTCYNNYYIENFQTFIANYFIYMVRAKFPEVKISIIKHIVFKHVSDAVVSHEVQPAMDGNITLSLNEEAQGNICALLKPSILEIRNRLPSFPMTKETLNKVPFSIMPALRYILVKYEALIEGNPKLQPVLLEHSEQTNPSNRKRPKKKKVKKNKKTSKDNEKKFVTPRLFSLFLKPSLRWRFIKIDSQNLDGIFPGAFLEKQDKEIPFQQIQRCFFAYFDFLKTNINSEEINRYFSPCAVDPNRKDAFISYHGNTYIRCLSSAEYYDMSGNSKRRSNVEPVETQIPSSKTTSIDHYKMYITYMLQHIKVLFNFYSFETARINWLNYVGSQHTVKKAVNILINGSKKYNKKKRKDEKK